MLILSRFLMLSFFSINAFAWGPEGQTIVVALAEKNLSPIARTKINILLSGSSLQSIATWADQARNLPEWRETGSWHYIDVVDKNGNSSLDVPADIRDAIFYCQEKLTSDIPTAEKIVWLKFLVHFLGDLHQPMHVGNPEDRGGNLTKVVYKGKRLNLHALWDSSFISEQKLGVSSYVEKLLLQSRSREVLNQTFNPEVVIDENLRHRKFLYSFRNSEIDQTYSSAALKLTDERLWTGGLRLASLLNSIFR